MSLNSNALTTVNDLVAYMAHTLPAEEMLSIYHPGAAGQTAATVEVTILGTLVLVITGGPYAGTETLTLSTYATITALKTAIDALSDTWVATILGTGNDDPTKLDVLAATDANLAANIQYLAGVSTDVMEQAINAASDKIEDWCSRTFAATDYTHLYSGTGQKQLRLRHSPVNTISRVAIGKQPGLNIKNTSTDAIQANVSLTSTTITLTVVGGANEGTDTVTHTADSLDTTVTEIVALGNGWTAEVATGADDDWLTADLFEFAARDALGAFLTCYLPEESIEDYEVDKPAGILVRGLGGDARYIRGSGGWGWGYSGTTPWELHALTAMTAGPIWPERMYNVYVSFNAGWSTVPSDVKRACNELAKNILHAAKRDGSLTSESVEGHSYTASGEGVFTAAIKSWLSSRREYLRPQFVEV